MLKRIPLFLLLMRELLSHVRNGSQACQPLLFIIFYSVHVEI